jgi:DNA-binding winged helix-turn-helix (wHTH) protein/TolB-like protein/Flp pilus assembly protein TadD
MIERTKHFYEFGGFRLDEGERQLLRDGKLVPLAPKVFDTLLTLVREHGHILEKDTLMKELWPETFVEESNLTYNISQLRKTLGDGNGQRYIETVPRRGYRFVAEVRDGGDETASLVVEERSEVHAVVEEEITGKGRLVWKAVTAVLAALLCVATLYVFRARARPIELRSLAILPFRNVTNDSQDEYLADGITDALITRLTTLKDLNVLSYSMVRRYKGSAQSAAEIGRQLGVDAVLESAMRRSGGRLRLSVHLINAANGFDLWADDHFESEARELLDAQSQLAGLVAGQLRGRLTAAERDLVTRLGTHNPEAYELMLRGRQFAIRNPASHASGSRSDVDLSVQLLKGAIAVDPGFAESYAWLGYALHQQFKYAIGDRLVLDSSVENTNRALALDPNSRVAKMTRMYLLFATGREREGPALARGMLASNPNDPDAMAAAAQAFFRAGMVHRATPLYQKSLAADPSSREFRNQLARCYLALQEYQKALSLAEQDLAEDKAEFWALELLGEIGRFDEAVRAMEIILKREPDDLVARYFGGWVLELAGHRARAREIWRDGTRRSEAMIARAENYHSRVWQGMMYAKLGMRAQALETIRRALESYPNHPFVLFHKATIDAILGDKEPAVESLRQAVDSGWVGIHYVYTYQRPHRELYNLRDDPQFQAVRARLERIVAEMDKQLWDGQH